MASRSPTIDKHPHFNNKKAIFVSGETRQPSIRNKYNFRANVLRQDSIIYGYDGNMMTCGEKASPLIQYELTREI